MADEIANLLAFWRRHYKASQRMLARALHENRVHAECLEIAMKVLGWYMEGLTDKIPAQGILADIKARLAELEAETPAKQDGNE